MAEETVIREVVLRAMMLNRKADGGSTTTMKMEKPPPASIESSEKLPTRIQNLIDSPIHVRHVIGIFNAVRWGCTSYFTSLSPENLSSLLSIRDLDGQSLIHSAAKHGQIELLNFFAKADLEGKLVNTPDQMKCNPITYPTCLGLVDVVLELIKLGADVNAKDYWGKTPLFLAACEGWLKLAQIFISHGADVNAKGKEGSTPLHEAAQNGQLELCEFLIEKGAEIDAADQAGRTPLTHAFILEQKEVVLMLMKHGADTSDKKEYAALGRYPADYLGGVSSTDCKSKTQNTKKPSFVKLRLSGSVVPLTLKAYGSSLWPGKDNLEIANIALSWYNEKRISGKLKGREYELVEVLGGTVQRLSNVGHCNFIARPKNESKAQNKLFFAEVIRERENSHCTVCVIISKNPGLRGCKICEQIKHAVKIQHPLRKKGFIKYRHSTYDKK